VNLYNIVRDECLQHGGPTERCQQIFAIPYTSTTGISRRRYWEAVQEGVNRHRIRKGRGIGNVHAVTSQQQQGFSL